jgi:hypothetical protein
MGWMESSERRRFQRVDLRATAMLLQRGGAIGRFVVQNLSASGALLTGAHDVRRSAPLRLVLELPGGEAVTLGVRVRRRATIGDVVALAVSFRHLQASSEDRIQEAILDQLDRSHREEHPAVLVVEEEPALRAELAERIRALGRRVLAVEAPLSALRLLDDPSEHIDALVMRDGERHGVELLEFVAETYTDVRALLFVVDRTSDPHVSHPSVRRCGPDHLREMLEPQRVVHA